MKSLKTSILIIMMLFPFPAWAGTYHLDIDSKTITVSGKVVSKIAVNDSIPGPALYFTEGEDVTITVTNHLEEDSSIHWHGLLLDPKMDGVPGLNGWPGIMPGETFTYKFKIRQTGTYWYHSHSGGQEQDGVYGALVIAPKGEDPVQSDRDYVVVLSDISPETPEQIIGNLKMSSDYYQYNRRTIGDFFSDVKERGFSRTWANAKMWGKMRMLPTDLSDVTGYTFLVNGRSPDENWTGLFKPGDRVRLRFINASAMSFYDVRIPGLKMQVVSSDGQNVEPVPVDEFRFGVAETYDVIVTPKEDKAYTITAEPIDRTGFGIGTLASREGMRGEMPQQRPRALLTMADMGMDISGMDHSKMDHAEMQQMMENMKGSWGKAGTPVGDKALEYKDLRYLGTQKDIRQPERSIEVRLGGNMERYIWTMNGKKYSESGPIKLRYGERVRLKFDNDTMMAHPMHLHGMFVQLENGQPAGKLPNKHTVIVPPGQSYSVLLTADEAGEWAFHCHLLYHMMAGMMTKAVVAKLDAADVPIKARKVSLHEGHTMPLKDDMENMDHSSHKVEGEGGPHHAH
jgi:FtsP/CotA-like multicopper oxidase with cupredoxin domain|tara:strand:- start:396 stop:2102 length:1707 start_codon:yes stop_codon:yes gene_type:complete